MLERTKEQLLVGEVYHPEMDGFIVSYIANGRKVPISIFIMHNLAVSYYNADGVPLTISFRVLVILFQVVPIVSSYYSA